MQRNRNLEALALLGSAAVTASTVVLYALGKQKEAAAIAVAGLLVGATIGAAKLLDDEETVALPQ